MVMIRWVTLWYVKSYDRGFAKTQFLMKGKVDLFAHHESGNDKNLSDRELGNGEDLSKSGTAREPST